VADALAAWAAWPDVLADPDQHGPHGVWTRREDLLRDSNLHSGGPLVAAWGETVWVATARWDAADPNLLWLLPLGPSADLPDPAAIHAPHSLAADIAEEIVRRLNGDWTRAGLALALTDVLERRMTALLADFSATVAVLAETVRRDRRLARARCWPTSRRSPAPARESPWRSHPCARCAASRAARTPQIEGDRSELSCPSHYAARVPDQDDPRLIPGRRELGAELRRQRQRCDLLLREVAVQIGMTESYLSDIERGDRLPSLPTLLKLADVYGVLLVEFFVDRYPWGTPTPPPD
jgi:DNA-binding XRE family transcriptional regulator